MACTLIETAPWVSDRISRSREGLTGVCGRTTLELSRPEYQPGVSFPAVYGPSLDPGTDPNREDDGPFDDPPVGGAVVQIPAPRSGRARAEAGVRSAVAGKPFPA